MRCPDCASLKSSHLYQVSGGRLVLTIVLALVAGIAGAAIIDALGFFVFLIGPAYGAAVAEVVLRVSGQKRGTLIECIGVGSIVLGALIVLGDRFLGLSYASAAAQHLPPGAITDILPGMVMSLEWRLLGIGLAISVCFTRLRYF